jgi:2-amino-4-hydroxy-6-hydroxymethyldihydropteridine diphosphokinase
MTRCFIALGANLGNPLQQVESALTALNHLAGCTLISHSPWYRSQAVGPGQQADYVNGVALLETTLSPADLLLQLQSVENRHGRQRRERWGPRTLDLDILLYGQLQLNQPELCIPHPRLQERNFVLYPLFDLAPNLTLPCGTLLESLLASCPREGLHRLGDVSDPGL